MRKSLYAITAAAITAITLAASVKPSEALIVYPWCANYGGRHMGGAPNCGFVTYAQCMATIQGLGGWCGQNPWYEPPPPRRGRRAPN
jgi:hypothetical protein